MESSNETNEKKHPLSRDDAVFRKALLADENGNYRINYSLLLVLRREKDKSLFENGKYDFEGRLTADFDAFSLSEQNLFFNFVGHVQSITINGKLQEHINFNEHKIIIENNLLVKGKNSIVIVFACNYNHSGVGLHHYTDPADNKEYLYTQFEPFDCNRMFPCFDQPDLKATLQLITISPSEWIVLSNQHEQETSNFKANTSLDSIVLLAETEKEFLFGKNELQKKDYNYYYFNQTPRISTYLFALCAGPYSKIECPFKTDVPMRIFFRESLTGYGELEEFFRVTIAGMKWYKEYFGIAYPFNKYDQIFCPEYNMGAMENVGLVTYNEIYCWKDKPTMRRRTTFAITVLHELAHMWFGNLVTMTWWDDLWLNESFATFISHLCMETSAELNKEYKLSFYLFNTYKGFAYTADQMSTTHPVMSDVKNTEIAETHFDEIVYEKGSSILQQLYYYIGDTGFSKGLKVYFDKFKWNNTLFYDFIDTMMKVNENGNSSDLSNLRTLCDNWLKKAGLNEIELKLETDENNKIKKFDVIQTPCLAEHQNLQTHMTDILFIYDIENESSNKVFKNVIYEPKTVTTINQCLGLEAPKAVILNYNDWAYFKWVIDRQSIDFLKTNLFKLNNLLTKQLVYRSLYDLTRDSRLSGIEYIEIILNLITKETNEEIIATVLRSVQGIISNYIPIQYYEKYSALLFDSVHELLKNALKQKENLNKEVVLHLIDYLIGFTYGEENILKLKNYLNEGIVIEGNRVDDKLFTQANRFRIVQLVHRSRVISKEEKAQLLETEVLKDKNSDRSVLARHACYAATPDAHIKQELWDKYVNKPTSDSLYNMETSMAYFASRDQLDLVKEYINDKFFDGLLAIGKNNDFFYVRSFISSLAPIYFVDKETIERLEKLAEEIKSLDAVRKVLLETIDSMKRSLKAHNLCEEYLKNNKQQ